MPNEEDPLYEQWSHEIKKVLSSMHGPVILVGRSVGSSILLKFLIENVVQKHIVGIFLIAMPFWGGDGWRCEGYNKLELPNDIASRLPRDARIFLYHSRDDEIVPFEHLALYASVLPQAAIYELGKGGHQMNNDLSKVAEDIKSLR